MKINKGKLFKWGVTLGAAATLVAGCSAPQDQGTGNSPSGIGGGAPAPTSSTTGLTGAGSTFIYPILSKWLSVYNTKTGVQINYQAVGSGAGIQQVKSQTVDFGASDAPLGDADLKTLPKPILQLPTVAGAEAVAYNLPGLTQQVKLDGPTLADMFLGNIKKWNDPKIAALNPGVTLPDLAIVVGHRSDGSGTTYIFTDYLSAVSPSWKTKVGAGKSVSWPVGIGGKGNSGVAGVIKQTPGALGYVELAYAEQNKLTFASIRNQAGKFVPPSVDGTTAAAAAEAAALKKDVRTSIVNAPGAASYPIAGFTYVLVYQNASDAGKGKELKAFLQWAMTDGQKMSKELYYAPLPKEVVDINEKNIGEMK